MGMFNNVYKRCPKCSKFCTEQISQIVDGFGDFNLDDSKALAKRLKKSQIIGLHDMTKDLVFWCRQEEQGCGNSFRIGDKDKEIEELAKKLFG